MKLQVFKMVLLYFMEIATIEVSGNKVSIKKFDIKTRPDNGYFGDVSGNVTTQGQSSSIYVKFPILEELDENIQIRLDLYFANIPIRSGYIVPLCSIISKDQFVNKIRPLIEPYGKFPSQCPIPAKVWKITGYVIDLRRYLPFGLTPIGKFEASVEVGMKDVKPFIEIELSGTISSKSFIDSLFSWPNLVRNSG